MNSKSYSTSQVIFTNSSHFTSFALLDRIVYNSCTEKPFRYSVSKPILLLHEKTIFLRLSILFCLMPGCNSNNK